MNGDRVTMYARAVVGVNEVDWANFKSVHHRNLYVTTAATYRVAMHKEGMRKKKGKTQDERG